MSEQNDEPTTDTAALIRCVREFALDYGEIDTPCLKLLRASGIEGVDALSRLIAQEASSDNEAVAAYAVSLLTMYESANVVPALVEVLRTPFRLAWVRGEVLESLLNHATGRRHLLDPSFVAAVRELRRTWQSEPWRTDQMDSFLAWADSQ
jgi:hypothetical protein